MHQFAIDTSRTEMDYELAFALYCGGLTFAEIMRHEKFRQFHPQRLAEFSSKNNWAEKKAEIARMQKGSATVNAAKLLQERLVTEGIKHQSFMLDELHRERRVFENRLKDEKTQLERLKIMGSMDDIARRTSKLDVEQHVNPITQGFAILVGLQVSTPDSQTNAPLGILRSNNAHLEGVVEADFVDLPPAGPEAPPPPPVNRPPGLKEMPPPGSLF